MMNISRSEVEAPSRIRDQLAPLAVVIPNPAEVESYLGLDDNLVNVLPPVCAAMRQEFGRDAELSLELYKDPEIDDRYLTLYVRLHDYDRTVMDRIHAVSEQFNEQLEQTAGYLLLTTDFRLPRAVHGV